MFFKISKLIRNFSLVQVSDEHRGEFAIGINRINVIRGKITAMTFIVLEAMLLIASFIIKRGNSFKKPNIYYVVMYALLLIFMIVYLLLFIKLENNISKCRTSISITGIIFSSFILFWCAGISLLDQLSYGQIIVYVVAIISIAITPLYKPVTLLFMYLTIHVLFLVLMPYFQKSNGILLGNYINSTAFIIISWSISYMRYKKYIEDFNNRKIIQKNSDELKRVNNELDEVNRELERLSQTDTLTGIFNRFVFDRMIKLEWDRCECHFIPLSLIMIDIDFFKAFNDNYGHQAGDDCLRQVARMLSDSTWRPSDIAARYGGEEFAIILPNMKKDRALEFAEQLRKRVEELAIPHAYSSISKYTTISLGIHTVIPSYKSSIEEFIRTTDKALYEAKKDRNIVVAA